METETTKFSYGTGFVFLLFHIGLVIAPFDFTWPRFGLAMLVWSVTGSLGIGVGFHRLLVHRGFKTYPFVEGCLALLGCIPLQGNPMFWVSTHRTHHEHAEKPGMDPHTPKDGFWWAHIGWMTFARRSIRSLEAIKRNTSDLYDQKFYRILGRIWYLPTIVLALILLCFYELTTMLWGVAVPVVIGWHSTWLVNSATHRWGSRRYETPDDSRNTWWVALLTFGEGWHNNHHAHPTSVRHGLAWYQLDINWMLIRLLRSLGLAWNLKEKNLEPKVSGNRSV